MLFKNDHEDSDDEKKNRKFKRIPRERSDKKNERLNMFSLHREKLKKTDHKFIKTLLSSDFKGPTQTAKKAEIVETSWM